MKSGQTLLFATAGIAAVPAMAADLTLKVTLPVIEQTGPRAINKPYVAIWVRKDDNTFVSNLAVWYQIEKKERKPRPAGAEGAGAPASPRLGPDGQPLPPRPPRVEDPKRPGGSTKCASGGRTAATSCSFRWMA
jgi:hypothetical protein